MIEACQQDQFLEDCLNIAKEKKLGCHCMAEETVQTTILILGESFWIPLWYNWNGRCSQFCRHGDSISFVAMLQQITEQEIVQYFSHCKPIDTVMHCACILFHPQLPYFFNLFFFCVLIKCNFSLMTVSSKCILVAFTPVKCGCLTVVRLVLNSITSFERTVVQSGKTRCCLSLWRILHLE